MLGSYEIKETGGRVNPLSKLLEKHSFYGIIIIWARVKCLREEIN
jgi:hypothetical protein